MQIDDKLYKHVLINEDTILYAKDNVNIDYDFKLNYKIDKGEKVIRLYNVPHILTMQEKDLIYCAILNLYYFDFAKYGEKYEFYGIENFIVKENGYSYHEFNEIEEKSFGILGELIFEIPKQEIETDRLLSIREIYNKIILYKDDIGIRDIVINFDSPYDEFVNMYYVIKYIFENDKDLVKIKDKVTIDKKSFLTLNKKVVIIPKEK